MKIINIDEALKLPQKFNVLMNAMDELYAKRQEEFQKSNPIKEIYQMVNLDRFQRSFGSDTGFKQAFERTVDYAAYPGFSSGDGFKTTISYQPFNGKVVFSWQTLLEADYSGIKDELSDFQVAWQRQLVQFAMFALTAFFGTKVYDKVSKTYIKIDAADTTDGDPMTATKNPVFSKNHTLVAREDMSAEERAIRQSNKFYANINLDGTDPLAPAKLANVLYQLKVRMSKLLDDNGQLAGVSGTKKIVATEDANLNQVLNCVLSAENFSDTTGKLVLNPVKNGFKTYFTPYLDGNLNQPIPQFATPEGGIAKGLLILDEAYNKANHGPMFVERVGFSMKAVKTDEPEGIKYLAKQAFGIYCPSWRGVTYLYIGKPLANGDAGYVAGAWNDIATFTEIKPTVFTKAVTVVGTVATKEQADE